MSFLSLAYAYCTYSGLCRLVLPPLPSFSSTHSQCTSYPSHLISQISIFLLTLLSKSLIFLILSCLYRISKCYLSHIKSHISMSPLARVTEMGKGKYPLSDVSPVSTPVSPNQVTEYHEIAQNCSSYCLSCTPST